MVVGPPDTKGGAFDDWLLLLPQLVVLLLEPVEDRGAGI